MVDVSVVEHFQTNDHHSNSFKIVVGEKSGGGPKLNF